MRYTDEQLREIVQTSSAQAAELSERGCWITAQLLQAEKDAALEMLIDRADKN